MSFLKTDSARVVRILPRRSQKFYITYSIPLLLLTKRRNKPRIRGIDLFVPEFSGISTGRVNPIMYSLFVESKILLTVNGLW